MSTQTSISTPTTKDAAATAWKLDPAHSSVSFRVRHLMIATVRGSFRNFSAESHYDPARPERTRLRASVEVASIDTGEGARDEHLRSSDFFHVDRFPRMELVSNASRLRSDGKLEIDTLLTLRDIERPVTFVVEGISNPIDDPWGQRRLAASATATVKRSDFGMTWNSALETGGVVVGDDVSISIEASFVEST